MFYDSSNFEQAWRSKKLSLSSIGNQDLDVSIEAANYGISMDEDITASFSSYAWGVEGLFSKIFIEGQMSTVFPHIVSAATILF